MFCREYEVYRIWGVKCARHAPPPLTPRILQNPAYLIPQKAFGTFANRNTYEYTCIHVNNIKIYIFAYIHTDITLHYIALHCIALHYITYIHTLHTLHYIALHDMTLHYMTLHCMT